MVNVSMFTMNKRELIADLISKGRTSKQIEAETGIPIATIRYYREKSKQGSTDRISEHRRRIKRKAIHYSGGQCIRCGYNRCHAALDFHHIDPTEKEFRLAAGRTWGWDKCKVEIDKTILICSNCHRELHDGIWTLDQKMIESQIAIRIIYQDRPLIEYAGMM